MKPFTIQIGSEQWKVIYVRRAPRVAKHDCDGVCNYGPRTIQIHRAGTEENRLETLLHEMIHARWPEMNEDAVELTAKQFTEAIVQHQEREE